MAEHTKGPWRAERKDGHITIWSNGLKIADVVALADFDQANANLIAASPMLLQALDDMYEHAEWSTSEGEAAFTAARKALWAAKGRSL